jgi:hypothetical protein
VEKEGGSIGGEGRGEHWWRRNFLIPKINGSAIKTTLKKKAQRRFICRSVDFWYLGGASKC